MRNILRDTLITIALAVIIYVGLHATLQNYIIWETCMEPNFYEGERVLVNKVVYKFHEPERGDVIILKPPPPYDPDSTPFIKRIIALPGELVEIKNGKVYINGVELHESYVKEPPSYTYKMLVPENEYFVLGDNRNIANDSHMGWTLSRENIIGKAWLSIWPPGEWGVVDSHPTLAQIE